MSCCQPTPSSSVPSREARSTCTRWWTLRLLRLRLPACLETARGRGGGAAQRRAVVLPPAETGGESGVDRQRETERHPYELYLDLNGIEHRRTKVRNPKTNGFVERFNGAVLEEFFRLSMHEKFYESVDALQHDLAA